MRLKVICKKSPLPRPRKKPTSLKEEASTVPAPATVSVIIPTYNRKGLLRETLDSLTHQTYPSDHFEVIIVDDGSTDGTAEVAAEVFPFVLRYFWQSNQGDAAARNIGARQSQADFLVFLDDDILVEPGYLTHLIDAHEKCQKKIVVGTCHLWLEEMSPVAQGLPSSLASDQTDTITELPFRDVFSNNMSLRREAYFEIGMMQGLNFPGSSMWCDLDFCYRAYQRGFEFGCSTKAVCWHRDYAAHTLDSQKKRARTAAHRAVVLFQKYPELLTHLPMFYDKTPILWGQDPPRLIARKLARSMGSSRPALWSMEQIVTVLEKRSPASTILPALYRYIIGGYIFRGYQEGLSEFGRVGTPG
jgi:glycosyltransferase involved in cell wall biosynthesis